MKQKFESKLSKQADGDAQNNIKNNIDNKKVALDATGLNFL